LTFYRILYALNTVITDINTDYLVLLCTFTHLNTVVAFRDE